MAFERLAFKKNWTSSADFPAYVENESQVRADLQYHPDAVREYLNGVLLAALEASGAAGNIGAVGEGVSGTVQSVLDACMSRMDGLDESVRNLAAGETPEAVRAAAVEFDESGWTEGENGRYLLRIDHSAHKREDERFGWLVRRLTGDVYRAGTWTAAAMTAEYDGETGDVVLTAEEPFAGRIVFFGV